ncbi:MAG: triphosphoribosyl-dephospho-CoA synthase [Rubrivivax sp.]
MTPEQAFLRACWLDVAVRKPGNVSLSVPGHGMQAQQFLDSAEAAAPLLCRAGERVGPRIEAAVAATRAAVGRNTNLGILLLCAPLALAAERCAGDHRPAVLRTSLQATLAELDVADAAAAYRAIVDAGPGGLGSSAAQDVHTAPTVTLRAAMVLAADRDRIARQYRDGYAEIFDQALQLLHCNLPGASTTRQPPDAATTDAVQALYLHWLATGPDSHIVRKHGIAVAQAVMHTAQQWRARGAAAAPLDADPAFAAWGAALVRDGLNPGTSADLTVAALMLAGVLKRPSPVEWHGS